MIADKHVSAATGILVLKTLTFAVLTASGGCTYISSAAPAPEHDRQHLYVASTGSDSNPGTEAKPFKTINRAASLAEPGTTVHVAPGTYNGNVTTSVSGTASARIRYLSDTKWGAKIVGTGTEFMWTNRGNYTDIVGFDITGPGRQGIINLASHTLIQGNHVHDLAVSGGCTGGGGAGINNANYKSSDGDIVGNVVHDIGVPGKCNAVHGIYSANLRGRIANNIVYRASAWGIHLWHAANEVTITNNTVFSNGAKGMGGGIVIGAGDKPGGVVLDNTIVVNNIVAYNPNAAIMEFCYEGQECTGKANVFANNLVYGNGKPISLRKGLAIGTIEADPQFVDFQPDGSGNYRLKRTSPALKSGVNAFAPDVDLDDTSRPRSSAPDIGAYQHR
jgi:parallel beta-helix repeat protein